ncbi:MAG: helix-turn-helix transcriptional regulator [Proteobacteria bacterium]|nr:helix-turn-helix transcriptional regulator [Pseudomonadota bacterium]
MPRHTVAKHGPHPVDAHVGSRVRLRRTLLGMNQTQLGGALGVRFQQLQKNERGMNRIGASRLWQLSQVLDVPVSYFFEGIEHGAAPEPVPTRAALELMRNFRAIRTPEVRNTLSGLVRNIAAAETEREGGKPC